jgi:predicted alpha/beta hydrolase
VARVVRDMKAVNLTAQGYPVQVGFWFKREIFDSSNMSLLQYQADMLHALVGVADIPKRMDSQIKACPDIKFALVGYSQGGSVVSMATAAMSLNLTEKIVAVVMYGSGDGTSIIESLRNRTIANCAPGDFVSSV